MISGIIPLSINGSNELSAAIFIDFFNFFNFGIAIDNDGPEPITKTVFPWIISLTFSILSVFLKLNLK